MTNYLVTVIDTNREKTRQVLIDSNEQMSRFFAELTDKMFVQSVVALPFIESLEVIMEDLISDKKPNNMEFGKE